MESLYSKLYDKYNKLKKEKDAELEQMNQDQEFNFVTYVKAAEEMVEHLKSQNNMLKAQIDELTDEVRSIRSDKDTKCSEYQNLLTQEIQKNKDLSEEVERLRNLQQEGLCCSSRERNNDNVQLDSSGGTLVGSKNASEGSLRKRSRLQHAASQRNGANQFEFAMITEKDSCRGALFDDNENIQQANCCIGSTTNAGQLNTNCLCKILVECLVGMQFAAIRSTEGLSLSALHQSSGYSFSLKWVNKAADEQPELLYQVTSLGTFERVAPEWMKEDLMFSTSMCHMFFKRVSRVIGLHY